MRATSVPILLALLIVYLVWGSTYLAIRFALQGFAPLFFPGLRFLAAGVLLFAWLLLRRAPLPSFRQWLNAALIGFLLLDFCNGAVVLAERRIGSALAATAVATAPLWAALFAGFGGVWPGRRQWLGLVVGFVGVVALNFGGDFKSSPAEALLLTASAAVWAYASLLSRRLSMPAGLMNAACQMLVAGAVMLAASAVRGESWQFPAALLPIGAVVYLAVVGSVIAFSAYLYLVHHADTGLAMSHAYANPVVALLLGVIAGEQLSHLDWMAIALVLSGVVLIVVSPAPANVRAP